LAASSFDRLRMRLLQAQDEAVPPVFSRSLMVRRPEAISNHED